MRAFQGGVDQGVAMTIRKDKQKAPRLAIPHPSRASSVLPILSRVNVNFSLREWDADLLANESFVDEGVQLIEHAPSKLGLGDPRE
jgi:hypothetical protein